MNVIIVGSGGREHALALKVVKSNRVKEIFISPGNAGTLQVGENVNLNIKDHSEVIEFCKNNLIDLVVIGPEVPLVDGLSESLRENNILVFGPNMLAAEIEGNKKFSKELMAEYNIPTANFKSFNKSEFKEAIEYLESGSFPIVIKASGLAAGKGVIIAQDILEAKATVKSMMQESIFGDSGETIVIEEFLEGVELSVFAITDGDEYLLLPASQDHKKIGEGDTGKNTGGMGAYAPLSFVTDKIILEIENKVVIPTLQGLKDKNRKFNGCLYCGLINTKEGIKVIEFNCRFGDPETQVVLPLLDGDFFELLYSTAKGKINKESVKYNGGSSVCVVTVSGGYPDNYKKGYAITGLENIDNEFTKIIHAGTTIENGKITTSGGRVLNVTTTLKNGS
ncbi:MAG: phosphoribosylamine--glycine ligase, partial [Ignavibacteriae bacterium]|nr:phosphoribosylamine--glycine ligase [Ignavibacteriota bacterium]